MIVSGALSDVQWFLEQLDRSFKPGKIVIDEPIPFR